MPPVDHIAHLAQHHHRIGLTVALMSSMFGTWICIWVAVFAGRKNTNGSDSPDEPVSSRTVARQKSPDRPTSFSV
jgi:hypothetical protein